MRISRRALVGRAAAGLPMAWAARALAAPPPVDRLRARLRGRLILPGDPDYEAARRGPSFGPAEDRRPAIIAQCADADAVAGTVDFAGHASLPLAVKSGGHDVLAACIAEGGLVIDLSRMVEVTIDAASGTARVGPGVRAGA